jgi:hypothetical protein
LSLDRRIERAERAAEWHAAYATAERLLRWAVATGQLTMPAMKTLRADLHALAPFTRFVSGTWQPPEGVVANFPAQDAMFARMQAWEEESTQ